MSDESEVYKRAWQEERKLKWALAKVLYEIARERDSLLARLAQPPS